MNNAKEQIRVIDNSMMPSIDGKNGLYGNRSAIAKGTNELLGKEAEVTIVILALNQLDKTKRCVESVLMYTQDVRYELILVDNGSTEPVLDYFKTIEYPNKKIIRFEKNISAGFTQIFEDSGLICRYFVELACDIVVTKNWLSNLLKVAKADEKVGMVNPVCNNTSNLQCVELQYTDWDDMQKKAALFNVSNPQKWEQRIRLLTLGTLYTRECLYAIGWPRSDVGFMHDFSDDDITFRVRRAGYKAILAGDTWICHDHPITDRFNNDRVAQSIKCGRINFKEKYFGLDAWEDVNNYIFFLVGGHIHDVSSPCPTILGIDVKCGTPLLDIKNQIRRYGKWDAELSAFTQEDKYSIDLHTICDGEIVCDREEFFSSTFQSESFDYLVLGRDINRYHEPAKMILDCYSMLRKGGQMFFSMKNAESILCFLHMMGYTDVLDKEYCLNYALEPFMDAWKNMNIDIRLINVQYLNNISEEVKNAVHNILRSNGNGNHDEMMNRLMIDRYWFTIQK